MLLYAPIYLAVVSLVAVILTLHDKNAAHRNAWRVKERTLLAVSVLGGSAAMLLTMLAVRHKTRRAKFMVGIPLIILVQVAIILVAFNQSLSVSHYSVETEIINGQVKLALVTDYHSCDYGDGQRELLGAIDAERPDAILLCGDIFDDKLPPDNTIEFIEGVSAKYPCYYVSGNHEFWSGKADEFKDILTSYGVKVLEGAIDVLEVRGDSIRICGVDDPDTDRYASRSAPYTEQIKRLSASVEPVIFTILLSHRPERIEELLPLTPDLVMSGHAHGGQWRIPFILENGLLSPNQGLFPKYTNGKYFFGDTELIVSRGLARESTAVPRLFNRPEIVVITLDGIHESEDTTVIELNLIPHDGIEIQSTGKVRFGQG
jgi:predicted MPP superfamily phosphohydrolase